MTDQHPAARDAVSGAQPDASASSAGPIGRERRPFWRKLLRGLAFLPFGIIPFAIMTALAGPIGAGIGMLVLLGSFIRGFTGEPAFGGSKATPAPAVSPPAMVPTAPPPPLSSTASAPVAAAKITAPARGKRRGLWWKIPVGATALIWVIGTLLGPPPPRTPSEVAADGQTGPQATAEVPTSAASRGSTEPTTAKTESKLRYFKQRPCNGIDDCTEANIAAEQTQASRDFNRTARDSMAAAVSKLGPPTFVLRSGDAVGTEYYEGYPTEMKFAEVIIGWANGSCSPNELHRTTRAGTAPMAGGTACMRDGSAYPLPPARFLCDGGRKNDVLCKLTGVLKLPGVAGRDVLATATSAVDQATAIRRSPEQHGFVTGFVMSGVSTCNGMYLGDVPTGGAAAAAWMAARRRGEAAGKAAMAKDRASFCDEIAEKYGPTGSVMPGMFKKLGP